MSATLEEQGTILGGLPVIARVSYGRDADTPNGPGEYWTQVEDIYWRRRDGSRGRPIPDHVRERAERLDPGFHDLSEQVCDAAVYRKANEAGLA